MRYDIYIYIYMYVIRRLKIKAPDHLDVRHYKVGRSSAIRTGHLYPRRNPWYTFSEAESTPGHMVPSEPREKSPPTPLGIDTGTVRLVAQCLNHCATPGPRLRYKEKPFDVVRQVSAVSYNTCKNEINVIGE